MVENCRVFITITGISKSSLYAAIEQSAVSVQTIILPVLTDSLMCSILADMFGVKLNLLPSLVANITLWLGVLIVLPDELFIPGMDYRTLCCAAVRCEKQGF